MERRKRLERTVDVITKICNRVDELYKILPKDTVHTGMHMLAVKSFENLTNQLNSVGKGNIYIVAADDPKTEDVMYIAYFDVNEETDESYVEILRHDFTTAETTNFDFHGMSNDDSSEIIARLTKDLPIEHTVALLAHFDNLVGSEITEITKTVVEVGGISAILTAFSRSDTEYQGTAIRLNSDVNASVDDLNEFVSENIMKFIKIFQTAIMMNNTDDDNSFLTQYKINPDNVTRNDSPDKTIYVNDTMFIVNDIMINYTMEDEATTVTVIKTYLSK